MTETGMLQAVLGAIGAGGSAAIVALWKSFVSVHARVEKRLDECEQDRELLHKVVTEHSGKIQRLEGYLEGSGAVRLEEPQTQET